MGLYSENPAIVVKRKQKLIRKQLTPFHPLTNFKIINYFKEVKGFNGVYSRNKLPKI